MRKRCLFAEEEQIFFVMFFCDVDNDVYLMSVMSAVMKTSGLIINDGLYSFHPSFKGNQPQSVGADKWT